MTASEVAAAIEADARKAKLSSGRWLAPRVIHNPLDERGVPIDSAIDVLSYGLDASLKLLDSLQSASKLTLKVFDALGVIHGKNSSLPNVKDEPHAQLARGVALHAS